MSTGHPHSLDTSNHSVSEVVVSIKDVDFSYAVGERQILSGLNMEFRRGQVVAVMGGSGCGMGMLFQFGALFTDLSVFENVAFPLREHTDLSEELLRSLVLMKLNAVGLRGARDLMPSQISGGMARRVALARAIALDPPLIMYDEPFAGLDPISLGITARLIRDLNKALGATSLLVTHDVEETFEIADYVYFIANGRIGAQGTPDELSRSADPFVRQFLDAAPDGPVPFHYPGQSLGEDFGVSI
jgi:phospholipid/cholesterol/gamma-HCH transport system ATP-binding protein